MGVKSALRRLLGGTEQQENWEYHLLQKSPEQRRVETFDRPVSPDYVRYELDLQPGEYSLQAVDPATKSWGPNEWTLSVEQGERDEIRAELEDLRADLARAIDGDDEDRPTFPSDRDELESELLGVLATEHGPDEALDRLERLEAARSSGDLASAIEDPTDTAEITGRVMLDAYSRYGDDLGAILDNLDDLTGGDSRRRVDPAELQRQIDAQARALNIDGPTAGADAAQAEAATDGGQSDETEKSPAKEIYEEAKQADDDEADGEGGDDDGD